VSVYWLRHPAPARLVAAGQLWLWAASVARLAFLSAPACFGLGACIGSLPGPAGNVVLARDANASAPDWREQNRRQRRLITWGTTLLAAAAVGVVQAPRPVPALFGVAAVIRFRRAT